jgi:hypothetical protein
VSRLGLGLVASCAFACLIVGACLPGGGPARSEGDDAGPGTSIGIEGDADFVRSDVDLGDPFALYGLTPSHGPYTGGSTLRLTGRGFTTKLRVFIGDKEVPTLAGDSTRAVVVTPPGGAGFVDVKIRDDASGQERVLKKGFFYDPFVVSPSTGATSGGTLVLLTHDSRAAQDGTGGGPWQLPVQISIGGAACTDVIARTPNDIECQTPPGSPGAKDVTVRESNGTTTQARDAFTYSDSPDGYRGGLGGGTFAGRMRVLAFDASTGMPIPGAYAIVGSAPAPGVVRCSPGDKACQRTSSSGVTEFNGLPVLPVAKATITVAAKCHQPITYVDVPVDTVTAYLPVVLDTACLPPVNWDPPSTGGNGGKYGGVIEGEIVFPGGTEFVRTGFSNVPAPQKPTERRAAYVFEASSFPSDSFRLPSAGEAITPDSEGTIGFKFSLVVYPGNATVYVVAGLEDRSDSPPRFLPYSMGVARGVSVPAQARVTGIDVRMDILFDHVVTVAPQAPQPGPRGPDRLATSFALTLGSAGYAILPRNTRVAALPAPATMPFVGVPSLDYGIAGEQYVLGAVAATGSELQEPASVISRIRTTDANNPVTVGGFLGVPRLDQPTSEPSSGVWGGTHVEFSGVTGAPNVEVVQIVSGAGLVTWTIVAPGGVTSFDVPDLRMFAHADRMRLFDGAIRTTVHLGRIEAFDYGRMRQGQIAAGSWNAHAFDSVSGVY